MQKLCPQAVVTGLRNTSRQTGQRTWSSSVQRLLSSIRNWPWGGPKSLAVGCRAGAWSWTGPGKTRQSQVEAMAGVEGPLRGTPFLLLEAAGLPTGSRDCAIGQPSEGHNLRPVFLSLPEFLEDGWAGRSHMVTRETSHFLGPLGERSADKYLRETLCMSRRARGLAALWIEGREPLGA